MELDFLLDRYKWELERKDRLTEAVGLPVTILTLLGGLTVAMAQGFSYTIKPVAVAFVVALILEGIASAFCLYWLAKNYGGSSYEYLPRLLDLETYRIQMIGSSDTPEEAEHEFESNLRERIINATDFNARTNDQRTAFLDRANQTLVVVLVVTAAGGVLYVLDLTLKSASGG